MPRGWRAPPQGQGEGVQWDSPLARSGVPRSMIQLTHILEQARQGDDAAAEHLAALLYDELRAIARREMAGERPDHTLQPTALVHEAYLRLVRDQDGSFENRAHFFGAAAVAIRRVLVEHARSRSRLKRGGDRVRLNLDDLDPAGPMRDDALLALDEALLELASYSPTSANIVELRFFAGMTIPELARQMNVSESTIERDWRLARAWLRGRLENDDEP